MLSYSNDEYLESTLHNNALSESQFVAVKGYKFYESFALRETRFREI